MDIAILYYIHFNLYYIYTILFYIYVCFRFGSPLHELSLSEATAMAPGPAGILMLLECWRQLSILGLCFFFMRTFWEWVSAAKIRMGNGTALKLRQASHYDMLLHVAILFVFLFCEKTSSHWHLSIFWLLTYMRKDHWIFRTTIFTRLPPAAADPEGKCSGKDGTWK